MKVVYADETGRIFDAPHLDAVGRSGQEVTALEEDEWMLLPEGATLVSLPRSRALGLDPKTGSLKSLSEEFHAVGALLPQGYTRLYLPAYYKDPQDEPFPLFGYTAVAFRQGDFYVSAVQSDHPDPWNPLQYDEQRSKQRVSHMRDKFPDNRLYEHLTTCALEYECVTSRNTFFERLEGAIPVSSTCNAGCVGCISEQAPETGFVSPQTRLTLRPTVDEMTELMVNHLTMAGPEGIISFGQGCEGEPSVRGREIAEAIKRTREIIQTGFININTNAGLTAQIKHIVDAGLNLMRVSIISALPEHYNAYYRPRGYTLDDVAASARYATDQGVIVALNYLIFPGVSDREDEIDAMVQWINETGVRLVQLRNLNIDPDYYMERIPEPTGEPQGMLTLMQRLRAECPGLRLGSYTHTPSWYS